MFLYLYMKFTAVWYYSCVSAVNSLPLKQYFCSTVKQVANYKSTFPTKVLLLVDILSW